MSRAVTEHTVRSECQRVEIARELGQAARSTTYVLDEPTTGLHRDDVDTLLHVLDSLVGPGRHGGTVLYEGHVADYTARPTPTCRALALPPART